jgi:hypothetical protein
MNDIPEEYELTSFFEVEPIKLDKKVPFKYNTVTYVIINGPEKIEIHISPAYGDIEIFWEHNNELKINWRLYDIRSLKIERKESKEYLIINFNAENMSDCYLWVKPNFKIIGGMEIMSAV